MSEDLRAYIVWTEGLSQWADEAPKWPTAEDLKKALAARLSASSVPPVVR